MTPTQVHTSNTWDRHLPVVQWSVLALTSLFLVVHGSTSVRYEFEDGSTYPWITNSDQLFHRVQAQSVWYHPGTPKTDTSLGTELGHYVYASYEEDQVSYFRTLYLQCQRPSGPGCRLKFNAIIHSAEILVVGTRPRCDSCTGNSSMVNFSWQLFTFNSTPPHQGWTVHSVLLGSHPVNFDIEFFTSVPEKNNFVALDDLELTDCEPEVEETPSCPAEASFRCDGLHECLSRDQLCDLQEDCLCGQDEALCADVLESHPEGYLRLDNCDFDSGGCLWYNVHAGGQTDFRWQVRNTTIPNELIHHKKSGSHPPPSNKHLHLSMSQQTPGSVAILRSVSFQAQLLGNSSCQVRFWYRNTAPNAVLHLQLMEITRKGGSRTVKTLWKRAGTEHQKGLDPEEQSSSNLWDRAVVDLNSAPVNFSYILQFKVTASGSTDLLSMADVALHSVSLSPECFHAALVLTSCGASGAQGPTQQQCDQFYHQRGLVSVVEAGQFIGVQSWTVPETMMYRIQAVGSKGGLGNLDGDLSPGSMGSSVTGKFKLHRGEKLYFLIGQTGEDSCLVSQAQNQDDITAASIVDSNTSHLSGGGGGGGATVVFKMTTDGRVQQVLLVAGGGAGLPLQSHHWILDKTTPSLDTNQAGNEVATMSDQEAELFIQRSLEGSLPCLEFTNQSASCHGRGGFGAGGGACTRGGHGGGASTIQDQKSVNETEAGLPGRSYIHSTAMYKSISADVHLGSGFVEVFPDDSCGCDYLCLWLDSELTSPTCLCRDSPTDLTSNPCPVKKADTPPPTRMFPLAIVGGLLAVFIIVVCLCLYFQRHTLRARNPSNMKQVASFLCPCVDLSRRAISLSAHVLPQIQRPPAVMHVNPNYNIITMKCPEHSLKELPRKHLKLMSALGQGAFGEVYYGLMSNVPLVDGDLAVAVKTLPPVCTEQMEMDFLMEAVIVSKFNHPNIVKLFGVCFEQRPHYMVLELLEGGDLKSFLRLARPKWDQPSALTVLDLLRLCLDVSRGCQHLEEKHFIHRDIAARNCLLTTKGPNRTAKIADFGMARDIYRSDYYKKSGKAMLPVKWMPPEAFLDGVFTSKTDVWSFGILVWEIFSLGHMPYPGCSNEEVMNLVTQGGRLDPPESCPSNVFDIMASCWSALPEGRPNFSLIIASLERTLQDDDMVSRGLPVFYVPPIINTRGLRLQDIPITNSSRPKVTTRAVTTSSNSAFIPDMADGYLEPLLTQSSRSQSHDSHLRSPTYNISCDTYPKAAAQSSCEYDSGQIFIDKEKTASKPVCRTPRIFYKPGSNFHSQASAAAEALLPTQNSLPANKQSQKDDQGFGAEQKYELCVNMNGHESSQEMDSDDFKPSQSLAANSKKKSYTNFPAPPT